MTESTITNNPMVVIAKALKDDAKLNTYREANFKDAGDNPIPIKFYVGYNKKEPPTDILSCIVFSLEEVGGLTKQKKEKRIAVVLVYKDRTVDTTTCPGMDIYKGFVMVENFRQEAQKALMRAKLGKATLSDAGTLPNFVYPYHSSSMLISVEVKNCAEGAK